MTKEFTRFALKAGLPNTKLFLVAEEVLRGKCDADLGGGVFKQRMARDGGGKSGGFRVVILFRVGSHIFFAHGFAKNAKANISAKELKALRRLADLYVGFSDVQLSAASAAGELIEVVNDGKDEAHS